MQALKAPISLANDILNVRQSETSDLRPACPMTSTLGSTRSSGPLRALSGKQFTNALPEQGLRYGARGTSTRHARLDRPVLYSYSTDVTQEDRHSLDRDGGAHCCATMAFGSSAGQTSRDGQATRVLINSLEQGFSLIPCVL